MKLLHHSIAYKEADLLQLDLSGVRELNIYPRYSNSYECGTLYIKIHKNVKRLSLSCWITSINIDQAKIRKINYSKIEHLKIADTRIKSIKTACIIIGGFRNKIKDRSYIGHGNENKYLILLKN
jgi:hypothetical protein